MKKGFWKTHLGDTILIACCACIATGLAIYAALPKGSSSSLQAEIALDGKRLEENGLLNLSEYGEEMTEFVIHGYHTDMTIGIKKDGICVVSSGCPTQYCVHQGWTSEAKKPLVCAYNHIVISILGESEADFTI